MFLGIETSGERCEVALVNDTIATGLYFEGKKIHIEKLGWLINDILVQTKTDIDKLKGIGVDSGPGSFTGIRIGVTTAKTLSQVLNIPIISVIGLDALAMCVDEKDKLVIPLVSALKNNVFTAMYYGGKRVSNYLKIDFDELLVKVKCKKHKRKIIFIGEDLYLYEERIMNFLDGKAKIWVLKEAVLALKIAWITKKRIQEGKGKRFNEVYPNYFQKSYAETNADVSSNSI